MSDVNSAELLKIIVANFVFMFFGSSGIGFSLIGLGVINQPQNIYILTLTWSTLWGFTGAALAWGRNRESIKIPEAFKNFLRRFGISNGELEKVDSVFNICFHYYRVYSDYLFVPMAHVPEVQHEYH